MHSVEQERETISYQFMKVVKYMKRKSKSRVVDYILDTPLYWLTVLNKKMGKPVPIFAFSSSDQLLVDIDYSTLSIVMKVAEDIRDRFLCGDYIIVQSSKDGFHIIYDERISWITMFLTIRELALWGIIGRKNLTMRFDRFNLTFRLTNKGKANSSPKVVYFSTYNSIIGNLNIRYLEALKIARGL